VTGILSISVETRGTAAAFVPAGDASTPQPVRLGDQSESMPTLVAAAPDGTVLVGDAAQGAEGPVVTDPVARAGVGRSGALSQVIGFVAGRAKTQFGIETTPSTLVMVIPDEFDAPARDHVVLAANGVGFTDVRLVPRSLIAARSGGDAPLALARGAALIAQTQSPSTPIADTPEPPITSAPDATPESAGPVMQGPASVFDPEPATPPVRAPAVAHPVDDPNRTTMVPRAAAPAMGPATGPQQMTPASLGTETGLMGKRAVPIGLIVVGLLVLLLLAMVIGLQRGGSESTDQPETDDLASSSSTSEPATTTTSTSLPETTTSTTTSTTTTTTSTTTTSTVPTTTAPVRLGLPGRVGLVENGLLLEGIADVRFGQRSETVLGAITSLLGQPDRDSGESTNDYCDGDTARTVRWGNLEVVFTGDVASGEPMTFTQWFADGYRRPTDLVTPQGLGVTSTVGFLKTVFGSSVTLVPAFADDDIGLFAITDTASGATLNGTTTGLGDDDAVNTLWSGDTCTRIFT
jgi:hypothetical protein